jgi:hypothetical protein
VNTSGFESATFRKAGDSGDVGCVEVAFTSDAVGVRDSKAHGSGPVLAFTPHEWRFFVGAVKCGEFDLSD